MNLLFALAILFGGADALSWRVCEDTNLDLSFVERELFQVEKSGKFFSTRVREFHVAGRFLNRGIMTLQYSKEEAQQAANPSVEIVPRGRFLNKGKMLVDYSQDGAYLHCSLGGQVAFVNHGEIVVRGRGKEPDPRRETGGFMTGIKAWDVRVTLDQEIINRGLILFQGVVERPLLVEFSRYSAAAPQKPPLLSNFGVVHALHAAVKITMRQESRGCFWAGTGGSFEVSSTHEPKRTLRFYLQPGEAPALVFFRFSAKKPVFKRLVWVLGLRPNAKLHFSEPMKRWKYEGKTVSFFDAANVCRLTLLIGDIYDKKYFVFMPTWFTYIARLQVQLPERPCPLFAAPKMT